MDMTQVKIPSVSISIRLDNELWQDIQEFIVRGDFENTSKALRAFVKLGLWVHKNKGKFENKSQMTELQKMWTDQMNEKQMLDWPKTLSNSQIEGVMMALDLEKEKRVKQ